MNNVPYALWSPRRSFRVLAGAVALAAQFAITLLVPVAEARASAPQHVEVAGTHLHYSHNPTDCTSCAAQQLAGLIERAHAELPSVAARHALLAPAAPAPWLAAEISPGAPRAPPSPLTRTR